MPSAASLGFCTDPAAGTDPDSRGVTAVLQGSRCDRRRELHVLVDQHERERRRIGTLVLEAAARAEVLDQAIEDALEHQVFAVLAPGASLFRVGEAVRLPRDREAD